MYNTWVYLTRYCSLIQPSHLTGSLGLHSEIWSLISQPPRLPFQCKQLHFSNNHDPGEVKFTSWVIPLYLGPLEHSGSPVLCKELSVPCGVPLALHMADSMVFRSIENTLADNTVKELSSDLQLLTARGSMGVVNMCMCMRGVRNGSGLYQYTSVHFAPHSVLFFFLNKEFWDRARLNKLSNSTGLTDNKVKFWSSCFAPFWS